MFYAGMDVGTSGCKLVAYDLDGNTVYETASRYSETGTDGRREIDPAVVIRHVREVLKRTAKECPGRIKALAIASMGETTVCLDREDRPLINGMLTGDCRGIEQTERLIREKGAKRIFEITGLPPNELYSIPKWMWIHEEMDVFDQIDKMMFFEDYVGYVLTGERRVSYSSAARSLAFDITRKEWSLELLEMAEVKKEWLSEPTAPFTVLGTIRPQIAGELGLPSDLKVVVGGHDQTCAAFGSGLSCLQDGELGMGTCEFMFMMLPRAMTTDYMLKNDFTCIPYLAENSFLTSLEITTCGILKNWARDTLFSAIRDDCEKKGINFFEQMDRLAEDADTGVLLLPQFGSSGNPDLSMDARGTIAGLSIHTTPGELYRAVLEGMAFQNYLAYERLKELGTEMSRITVTGGGAASGLTNQIRADVFNMPVRTLRDDESGTLGCMMMAAVADGAYRDADEAVERAVHMEKEYAPDPERHAYYMRRYEKYQKLYELMHDFK